MLLNKWIGLVVLAMLLGITGQTSELPEVLRTFVEEHDFSGKTISPFLVTDGGDLEDMRDTLYELEEPEAQDTPQGMGFQCFMA